MIRHLFVFLSCLYVGCGVKDSTRPSAFPESTGHTTTYSVGEIAFSVPNAWQEGRTNTPATKLFLVILDGNGGAGGMIKVDAGNPVSTELSANAEEMESRFGGQSRPIHDGSVILTSTPSTSTDTPRYIFTTMPQGKVYFVFVAANDPDVADEACRSIEKTLKIESGP